MIIRNNSLMSTKIICLDHVNFPINLQNAVLLYTVPTSRWRKFNTISLAPSRWKYVSRIGVKAEICSLRVNTSNEVIIFEFFDDSKNTNLIGNVRIDALKFHANFERIRTLGSACRILEI